MKKNQGFTIIEVMLIVILISILAAIAIPRFVATQQRAKIQACEMNRAIINKQIELYYFVESTWPLEGGGLQGQGVGVPLSDIGTNVNYFPDGIPTCPVDLTSYMLRPSPYHRISGHREGSGTHDFYKGLPQR